MPRYTLVAAGSPGRNAGYTASSPMDLSELRALVQTNSGFDILTSSHFVESYVCHLLGAKQTRHSHRIDGLLGDVRIEIKHAIGFDVETDQGARRRFCFRDLQGKKGKEADVYVMVGLDGDELIYLVIPSVRLGTKRDLDYFSFHKSGVKSETWEPYRVSVENLEEAVSAAAGSPKSYRGWRRPDLFA